MSWDARLTTNCLTSAVYSSRGLLLCKLQVMSITVVPGGGGGRRQLCCQSRLPKHMQSRPILGERNLEEAHHLSRFAFAMHASHSEPPCFSRTSTPVWLKFNYTTAVVTLQAKS